ncbi:hypothetical protein ACLB2K_061790 [Fragaria x ananassa]
MGPERFALLTAMPASETVEFLASGKIQANKFDALVCSSGSEVYYPGLKKTIWKLLNAPDGERNSGSSNQIEEDLKSSNSHCISYLIKDPSKARKADDLRQKLRMHGLRCYPMYLFVRWRLNVPNIFMFLGESGDTDYEETIAGTHKTIIMKGVVGKGPEELLRTSGSYVRDDIVPPQSPLVAIVNGQAPTADEIATALKQVSKYAAGM